MVNGSDLKINGNFRKIINNNFTPKKNSKISIVRVASHLKDLKSIIPKLNI